MVTALSPANKCETPSRLFADVTRERPEGLARLTQSELEIVTGQTPVRSSCK